MLDSFTSGFFFNDAATTEIYTLSLRDALPICKKSPKAGTRRGWHITAAKGLPNRIITGIAPDPRRPRTVYVRSEEHTSELQSRQYLVCSLLLEKKNRKQQRTVSTPISATVRST